MESTTKLFDQAIGKILEQLIANSQRLLEVRREERRLVREIAGLQSALENLNQVLSAEEKAELSKKISDCGLRVAPIEQDKGTESYRELLNKLRISHGKEWKAEEVQRFLSEKGYDVSDKYAYNTLNRLYEKGMLTKVRRGTYKLNDLYVGIVDPSNQNWTED